MIAFWVVAGILVYFFISFFLYAYFKQKKIGATKRLYNLGDDYSFTATMAVFWPILLPIYFMYALAQYAYAQVFK